MANVIAISGTSFIPLFAAGDTGPHVVTIEITDASSLAMDVQTKTEGGAAADSTYVNLRTAPRTFITAGTDITANGLYGVLATPGMVVGVTPSAGTANARVTGGLGTL